MASTSSVLIAKWVSRGLMKSILAEGGTCRPPILRLVMSNSRHSTAQVRSYSITHPPGRVSLPTQPGWDYLVFAHTGLFTALAGSRAWTIPAHRALCVPDGTRVRIETARRTAIRCLYFDSGLRAFGNEVRVVTLTPLTRELVSHAVVNAPMNLEKPSDEATIALIADRLASEPDAQLHLPLPLSAVARQITASIMSDPSLGLDDCLRDAHASRRTVERHFKAETGMSLGQWRRRARILASVAMLAQGDNVTRTALRVGYATPSSFVSAFRSELGSPPREFMRR